MATLPSDISGTRSTIQAVATNVAAIVPYVQAVKAIPLGAQPLSVDGTSCGSYDPLGGAPATEAALSAAQSHCQAFSKSTLSGLFFLPEYISIATGSSDGPGILKDLSILESIQNIQNPTSDQQTAFYGALNDIVAQISTLEGVITPIQTGAQNFQANMSADVQAFTNGTASLATTKNQMEQNYENLCIQYAAGPLGGDICKLLGSIYGSTLTALDNLQNSVNASVKSEASVVPALSKLQDLFNGLKSSYFEVAQQVQQASQQQFLSIMQQIDVSILSQYWQDAESFASQNGFGVTQV